MAWYRAGGGGIPSSLKTGMNSVLNKKFGTATTYDPADWPDDVNLLGKLPEKTASGALVNILDGADDVPIKALSCSIVPQGGNGTPSSPVPITGTSKIKLTHSKKNLLNADKSQTIVRDKTIQCPLKAGTYTMSFDFISTTADPSPSYLQVAYATDDGTKYNPVTIPSSGKCTRTFTLAFDSSRFTIYASESYASSVGVTTIIDNLMIEVGSSASTYEEYDADTYEIDMPVGKNLLPNDLTTQTVNGTTFTVNADKSITISGTPSTTTKVYITTEAINIETGSFFSFGTMPTGTRVFCSRTSGGSTTYPTISPSHTATIGAEYTNFLLEVTTSFDGTAFTIYPMLEVGSTATSYVPYKTVFGGSYEEDGSLTETLVYRKISAFTWTKQTASGRDFFIATSSIMTSSTQKTILCDMLPYGGEITVAAMADKSLASCGVTLRIYDTSITDVPTLLSTYGNGEVVYPLANPTETQIDPLPQINTHLGVNNFWTDVNGGETEVTYRADIDLALGGN